MCNLEVTKLKKKKYFFESLDVIRFDKYARIYLYMYCNNKLKKKKEWKVE